MNLKDIKHVWTVLCEKVSIDQQTNNVSLFNVTEQLNFTRTIPVRVGEIAPDTIPEQETAVVVNREIVTLWRRAPGAKLEDVSCDAKIELVDPRGTLLESLNVPLQFKHFKRLRTRVLWQNLRITTPGEYFFRILLRTGKDFELVAELPLEITLRINGINEPQSQFMPATSN